jgi:hypothetical protein
MSARCFESPPRPVAWLGVLLAVGPACGSSGSLAGHRPPDGRTTDASVEAEGENRADANDSAVDEASDRSVDGPPGLVGTVVDFATARPLVGREVRVGIQTARTDLNGTFALPDVGAVYDVIVVDPDGTSVSVYQGLSRRDPVLPHRRSSVPDPISSTASVSGDLSGGGPYPLGPTHAVAVYFFSPLVDNTLFLRGGAPPGFGGPAYGPMPLSWSGPGPISGKLIALGSSGAAADGGPMAWFGSQTLMLANGQSAIVDLGLAPIAERNISGTIEVPAGYSLLQSQVFYRLPIVHSVVGVINQQTSSVAFDYEIPDLQAAAGAQLCVAGVGSPGNLITQRCGVDLGAPGVSVALQAAPSLATPEAGARFTQTSEFSWSAFANGIHLLELQTVDATQAVPNIYVFTADTSSAWPDLNSIGVSFPSGDTYRCTIVGLGPYAVIDDALGPQGIGAPFAAEVRRSFSVTTQVTVGP